MKESSQKLMSTTDTAGTSSDDFQENRENETQAFQFGSFVALKRLSKLNIEAVRMQGCADGGTSG